MGSVKSWLDVFASITAAAHSRRAAAAVAANADDYTGRHPAAPPLRPRAPHLPEFKTGDTVAFNDKYLANASAPLSA